jgi:hypothetical protein
MKIGSVLAIVAALSLALAGSASGAASVDIRENAVAVEGGRALLVFVEVECSLGPNEVLLEGNVSASQDDAAGMGGLNPVCDGRNRVYPVRVATFGGTFEAGEAFASAFLLFFDQETQQTSQAGDATVITIRGGPA